MVVSRLDDTETSTAQAALRLEAFLTSSTRHSPFSGSERTSPSVKALPAIRAPSAARPAFGGVPAGKAA
jgi:hypothetical protein